jgi:hypothetical protein
MDETKKVVVEAEVVYCEQEAAAGVLLHSWVVVEEAPMGCRVLAVVEGLVLDLEAAAVGLRARGSP